MTKMQGASLRVSCPADGVHFTMRSLGVVLCVFGIAVTVIVSDAIQESLNSIELPWKNALLPCTCTNGTLNCSYRAKTTILEEDACDEPVVHLNIYNNLFVDIPDEFRTAIVVNASRNRIRSLPRPPLVNLQIRMLDLSFNVISNVTDELKELSHLKFLHLEHNSEVTHLQFLPESCALRFLNVSHNAVLNMDGPLLLCTQLRDLDLSNNELTLIPLDAFRRMMYLEVLRLSQNPIASSLTEETFASQKKLKELDISSIGLTRISRQFFSSLKSLEKLKISGNNLTTVPDFVFSPLVSLKHLDLSLSYLEAFPVDILDNIYSLEHLYLSENEFTTVPPDAFKKLVTIRTLYLATANISNLPSDVFSSLRDLRTLSLRENQLNSFPEGLLIKLEKLETLDLSFNPWNKIPIEELKFAKHVFLESCDLDYLEPNAFLKASHLISLSLRQNRISSIDESAFEDLTSLQVLNLGENNLTSLPDKVFRRLGSLNILYLSHNSIESLQEGIFLGLTDLKQVILSYNNIRKISRHVFDDLILLEELDLSNNELTDVAAETYINMRSLRKLSFKNNRLKALPNVSHAHAAVLVVTFDGNAITRPEEQILRQWISGDDYCYLELTGVNAEEVRWLLTETQIRVLADESEPCRCGFARHRRAVLRLCLNRTCELQGQPPTWMGALLQPLD